MREEKVRINKINSIMFQIAAANVAILLAFIVVMGFVMTAM
jgi:methyl-accepting chemotaxis protein